MWIVLGILLLISLLINLNQYLRYQAMQREKQENTVVPVLHQQIQAGRHYNLLLSNGTAICNVLLLGQSQVSGDDFVLGGWEGMLVLQHADGKKEFVKSVIIRQMREI